MRTVREISFLTDLPDDLQFVLALHEASVVGMATGFATVTERPALVNLHTTAGLGNAVGAPATAPQNVPNAVARAWHEATDGSGPAIVIVPSDDWAAPAEDVELAAPAVLRRVAAADPATVDEPAALLFEAVSRGGAGVGLPCRPRRLLRGDDQRARRGRTHVDRPHRTTRSRDRRHTRGHVRTVTAHARRHSTRSYRWRTLN